MTTCTVDVFDPTDLVAMAQCTAIDADAFPYASSRFGVPGPRDRVWIARRDGRVEGFVAGRISGDGLRVHGLAVAVSARGQGVGRALVQTAVSSSYEEGLDSVRLNVWVGNTAAIALYESEGFSAARRLTGFYPAGAFDGPPDAFEMERDLGD
ncbi:MAG TPA: GNAT family N-acetyltransferase [Polyangiaceae bacterium]|jgi:ribosomal protein S18 acetylase RimI-like enzyme